MPGQVELAACSAAHARCPQLCHSLVNPAEHCLQLVQKFTLGKARPDDCPQVVAGIVRRRRAI
jgi:hypothetical protein